MKLHVDDIIDVLEKEIEWCGQNPDKNLKHDYQIGFRDGLKQAVSLIELFSDSLESVGNLLCE